jgi:SecD/SecF fusion protein
LTILGYSLYDTIIVFDRVRENIPRMPRAAFSQIVNRSMSEVLTRSLATTTCTLLPVLALLLFGGGGVLGDFAFALLIGIASGAYSSIFIASPVLTHWKEREHVYRARRHRLIEERGFVPAYAGVAGDVEPAAPKRRLRPGRLTTPEPETVSAAEFEEMKRDLEVEEELPTTSTSTLTKRLARRQETAAARARPKSRPDGGGKAPARPKSRPDGGGKAPAPAPAPDTAPTSAPDAAPAPTPGPARASDPKTPDADGTAAPEAAPTPAPDIAENEGVAPVQKPKPTKAKSRSRSGRHGRRR